MTQMLKAATQYAQRGWPVFPCRPHRKDPATRRGLHDATLDPGLIAGWWEQWPDANVAIRTGRESGLIVLDIDGDDGHQALQTLERKHGELPRTASVVTPRGGAHLYFQHPGVEIRNSTSKLGDSLDVRGDGGYVLAPPSQIGGRQYEPDKQPPIAATPTWLVRLLTTNGNGPKQPAPVSDWIGIVRDGIPHGRRHAELARLTGHLLRRNVDALLVLELVRMVAGRCHPPFPVAQADRIVTDLLERDLQRRATHNHPAACGCTTCAGGAS